MREDKLQYRVETLQTQHTKPVIELFIKSFCHFEPITQHLDVKESEYRPFATEVVEKAIRDGLSTVALDKNGRLIAFIIVEDIANPFRPHLSHYPSLSPVFELLDELSRPFLEGKTFKKGKIAHFWIAGVEKEYMGKGLFTELDDTTIRMAADRGFDFAYAEFTNQISEKVTQHFKLIELWNRINYSDFRLDNGMQPFKDVEGGAAAYCAAIKAGIKLDSLNKYYTVSG